MVIWGEAPTVAIKTKIAWWVVSQTQLRVQSVTLKFLGSTILQGGFEFPIFLLIFACA